MKLNILNGYLIPSSNKFLRGSFLKTMKWLMEKLQQCREEVQKDMLNIYTRYCLKQILLTYDGFVLGRGSQGSSFNEIRVNVLQDIKRRMKAVIASKSRYVPRDPVVDFGSTVQIFSSSAGLLLSGFAERRESLEVITRNLPTKDFFYESHTEEPEGITSTQWKKRGKIWEEALSQPAIEFDLCNQEEFLFSIETFSRENLLLYIERSLEEEILPYMENILDRRRRVKTYAEEFVVAKYYQEDKGLSQVFCILNNHAKEVEEKIDELEKLINENPFCGYCLVASVFSLF